MSRPGLPAVELDVPADFASLAPVRAAVITSATAWGFTRLADLELVTSELVTNAVAHTGEPSVLICAPVGSAAVVIAVTDAVAVPVVLREPYDQLTRGRGLAIIDAVASSWGAFTVPGPGKTVWARLDH